MRFASRLAALDDAVSGGPAPGETGLDFATVPRIQALAAILAVVAGAAANAQPACTGNACRAVQLSVSSSCVLVTNNGDRPAIVQIRVRDEVVPVALEAPDTTKVAGSAPPSPQQQRRATECASAERSKSLLDQRRAQGANVPFNDIDRLVAACRADLPVATNTVATTPEQGQHVRRYDVFLGRDRPVYLVRPLGPGGQCIPALTDVTAFAANESDAASLARARQQAAAIAAKPAPTIVTPVCDGGRSTLAAPASYSGPHGEVGVVRRIFGIPINLDYDAVKAELQKLGRPIVERPGIGIVSLESKCGNETARFNFTADRKQLYSAGHATEAASAVKPETLFEAVNGEFGPHWFEKSANTASGTVVTRYWLCDNPAPTYTDGAESFLSTKCHYTARFDAPNKLRVSYLNEPVRRAHDQAAKPR